MPLTSKVTIQTLRELKRQNQRFAVLTCYDHPTARIIEDAGIEAVLVGDTIGEVILGHDSTLPVRLDFLLTITEAVRRGAPHAFLIGDMPYLTYQINPEEAVRNAGRFMVEARCDAVKIEVDRRLLKTVEALATATIPVIAHLGLKPQSIHAIGGYRCQGKTAEEALRLLEDARMFEEAGAVGLLLEAMPLELADIITRRSAVPVIGCVAGPHCDGTVVVLHDMLGLGGGHPPRTVKRYAELNDVMAAAIRRYGEEVHAGEFPTTSHSITMPPAELKKLQAMVPPQ
jgi:3-methyl-2-oxobutanoate hydroxymethyltransferase